MDNETELWVSPNRLRGLVAVVDYALAFIDRLAATLNLDKAQGRDRSISLAQLHLEPGQSGLPYAPVQFGLGLGLLSRLGLGSWWFGHGGAGKGKEGR